MENNTSEKHYPVSSVFLRMYSLKARLKSILVKITLQKYFIKMSS